jgi:hypothetical protein
MYDLHLHRRRKSKREEQNCWNWDVKKKLETEGKHKSNGDKRKDKTQETKRTKQTVSNVTALRVVFSLVSIEIFLSSKTLLAYSAGKGIVVFV